VPTNAQPSPQLAAIAAESNPTSAAKPLPGPASASAAPQPKSSPAAAPTARWSRNFLSGSTPLIPAHDNLDYVSSSYPAEFPLLLATSRLLLFPVSGSGGRIAVHDRQARGRMPLVGDVKTLEVGTELVDIALDPVEVDGALEVATAGKDGKIKIWSIPCTGLNESVHEPTRVLDAPGLDKVAKLTFSPTVKHLLAVASTDFGDGVVRVVDTQSGSTLTKEKLSDQGVSQAIPFPTFLLQSTDAILLFLAFLHCLEHAWLTARRRL
jgi:WD40 repeat protein